MQPTLAMVDWGAFCLNLMPAEGGDVVPLRVGA